MPPPGIGGIGESFFGFSATIASVGDQEASNGSGILKRDAHHLDRVDDALLYKIAIFAGLGVVAEVVVRVSRILPGDYRAVLAGIGGDDASRSLDRLADDVDAGAADPHW